MLALPLVTPPRSLKADGSDLPIVTLCYLLFCVSFPSSNVHHASGRGKGRGKRRGREQEVLVHEICSHFGCIEYPYHLLPPLLPVCTAMDRLTRPIRATGCSLRVFSRSCQWSSQTSTSTWVGTRSATAAGEPDVEGKREGEGIGEGRSKEGKEVR